MKLCKNDGNDHWEDEKISFYYYHKVSVILKNMTDKKYDKYMIEKSNKSQSHSWQINLKQLSSIIY